MKTLERNTMKTLMLTTVALALISSAAFAAPAHTAKAASTKKVALICPVTGDKIASASKAYNHEAYKGKTYYFCCPECKPAFDKNPGKAIANAAKGKYEKM
jgi:YHS domain-containing protein